jgi:hypothetical protein
VAQALVPEASALIPTSEGELRLARGPVDVVLKRAFGPKLQGAANSRFVRLYPTLIRKCPKGGFVLLHDPEGNPVEL